MREALELEPDAPDLLNNLAMALRGQGKQRRPPGSCTTCSSVSRITFSARFAGSRADRQRRPRRCAKTLAKLIERPRLHISEFAAIGACYVRLAAAVGDIREARMWLKRIAEVYPDYSELPVLRKIIELARGEQAVEGLGRSKQPAQR